MRVEWDEKKRRENIKKHGIDFADAYKIFTQPLLKELDDRFDYDEERWIGIGFLEGRIVVVVFMEREDTDEEVIRIISLRKALTHERSKYEQALRNRLGTN